jgi:pSer/pThr/pTyr-binding forkhead associated (FHA) protein
MLRYQGNNVLLSQGDFVLGRGTDCGLQIDDVEASRKHAVLHVGSDSITVEDLGSRNGMRLNGTPIKGEHPLSHGDVLTIGKQEIQLIEEDERQRRAILTTVQSSEDGDRLSDELVKSLDMETGITPGVAGLDKLSKREQEVLRLVALGHTHKEVAKELGVSVKTVETYRSRINDKMGFQSRAELVRFALRAGLMNE